MTKFDESWELHRLMELKSYEILDTEREPAFDQITSLASVICGTPIAVISLLDAQRQWFKSAVGLDATETPRCVSFCDHAIRQDGIMEISDATSDPRFSGNPLVIDAPYIRFYAGAPLISPNGHALGTLCVIDDKPGSLSEKQKASLMHLAEQVVAQMELRKKNLELTAAKRKLEDQQELLINKAKLQTIGELTGGICHQISNPLTIIVGRAMMLRLRLKEKDVASKEEIMSELDVIDQTVNRVSSVLKALKTYSKDMGEEVTECHLEDLVEDSLLLMKSRMDKIEVDIDTEKRLKIKVNKNQLTQVILNVIGNSVEALENHGNKQISVSAWSDDKHAYLDIKDNGPGIKNTDAQNVFVPFFSTKPLHFGIGLSNAKAYLEQNQGKLLLLKEQGPTTFRIQIPKAS
ncbi:GAF domain-containing sensor histidine kinase [Peredibacter starrii]|uniref:histidine kinase n=1 Tax=Peredibacter starrii TaxID=28202 RepID=A0AAX4HJZ5_9BACT|nr:GAF domain-containing sensor histidine kinase [Peredibacter starrii]WPU63324.1 GAF domain-containing sensor histidine kinase [Peredibacter starrii]